MHCSAQLMLAMECCFYDVITCNAVMVTLKEWNNHNQQQLICLLSHVLCIIGGLAFG